MTRKIFSGVVVFALFLALTSMGLAKGPQHSFGPRGDGNISREQGDMVRQTVRDQVQERRMEMKGTCTESDPQRDQLRERVREKDTLRERLRERKMEHVPELIPSNPSQ